MGYIDVNELTSVFELEFQAFVTEHGLDKTHCVQEAWERLYRQYLYCHHAMMKSKCPSCRKPPESSTYGVYGQ